MVASVGMALMSTLSTSAAVAAGTGAFIGGTFLTHLLVTTALGAALNALTPKPRSGASGGYNVTASGSALDHQVVYGKVRVAGARVFDATTGDANRVLHRVLAFTGHEIESFEDIYINDEVVTLDGSGNVTSPTRYNGVVTINKHLGSPDQGADSDLIANVPEWTSDHRLRGISYLYVKLSFDADAFPNGVPEITSTIKGKKVYDPLTGTTVWSDNPALCLRDYLSSQGYGLGEEDANIDDTLVSSSATVCDQTNTAAGTTRYTCNGAFLTAAAPYDTCTSLLTSMIGTLWYAQGKWRMKPSYWTDPVLSLDEGDLRSSISVSTRHSRRDNFNSVNGTFRGAESNWQVTDFPPVTSSGSLVADNGQEKSADLPLSFTDNSIEARRIARIVLERNRQQLTVTSSFGLRAFQVQVGDNISLTLSRFGWSNRSFEVTAWSFGLTSDLDLQVTMTLRETSSSVFDEIDDGAAYERDNTNLLSPFEVPPVGISATSLAKVISEKLLNILSVDVTSTSSERIDYVDVYYKKSSDTDWISLGSGELGNFQSSDLDRSFYDVRARAINTFGIKGTWEYLYNFEVDALSNPPADITNFVKTIAGRVAFLSWDAVADLDLSYYQIRYSTLSSGFTWGTSEVVVTKVGRPATSVPVPLRSGTFLIKAYDKGGNESVNFTSQLISPSEVPTLGTSVTVTEDPTFSGAKTNVVVDTIPAPDELIISDRSASSNTGTYYFNNQVDLGSSLVATITGYVTYDRYYPEADNWDDIPGLWDSWPDVFDTWTDEQNSFSDTSAVVYVSASTDNITFGGWSVADGSQVTGRYFKFKAVLVSSNVNVSPAVKTLYAEVGY